MKTALKFIVVLFFIYTDQAIAQFNPMHRKASVLFIGNTYTETNDLTVMLDSMAIASGDTLEYAQYTPAGYSLQDHCTDPSTLSLIQQQQWDYVVLQEQSQRPALDPSYVDSNIIPYVVILDSIIKRNNPCSKIIFFETWGRRFGDNQYCVSHPSSCTYSGMQQRIKESYLHMADVVDGIVAPVGEAFKRMMQFDSNVQLFQADNSHASVEGTYLAAVVFHEILFHRDSYGNNFLNGFPLVKATILQLNATRTVTDSLQLWNLGENEPWASFTWQQMDVTGLTGFYSVSDSTFKHFWNFGDNTTSTAANPIHQYTNSQYYPVVHTVCNSCRCDTFWLVNNIDLHTSVTAATPINAIKVFPSMVTAGTLWIVSKGKHAGGPTVYRADGKNISINTHTTDEGWKADVSMLIPGVYFVKVDVDGKNFFARFEKQ